MESQITNNKSLSANVICITGRVRIAHVPYAKSLAMEKKKVVMTAAKVLCADTKVIDNKTIAQTTKGGVRVAHIPQVVSLIVKLINCDTT